MKVYVLSRSNGNHMEKTLNQPNVSPFDIEYGIHSKLSLYDCMLNSIIGSSNMVCEVDYTIVVEILVLLDSHYLSLYIVNINT